MATTTSTSRRGGSYRERRENRRALYRFAEFWAALQAVGDVLAEADRLTAAAGDAGEPGADPAALDDRHPRGDPLRAQALPRLPAHPLVVGEAVRAGTNRAGLEALTIMSHADRIIADLDTTMRTLRLAMRGIPIRRGSFKKTHDNLARDVANVTAMLDAARPALRKN